MKKMRINPETLFYIISTAGIIIMFIMLMISKGRVMYVMGYGESIACDFWDHIKRLLQYESLYGNLNDADAIFPPLAYCFLQLFAQCLRHFHNNIDIAATGYGILVLNMYLLIFLTAFIGVLNYSYKPKNKVWQVILPFIFLFSYPFWGCAIERGNPVIYAMLFLLAGVMMRKHENRIIRELAMISLAIAAGFKIYPALFGLIWIREKSYKEALRLLIYGMIAFFVPFIFFGGINGMTDYVGTFMRYMTKDMYSKTSILGNCIMIFGDFGKNIGKIITVLWIMWVGFYLFAEGVTWKTIALLTSTHTILLAESYVYTYVFIVIPCILFLNYINEQKSYKKIDYVYAVLFALVFTIPPFVNIQSGVLIGIYICWICMLVFISTEEIIKLTKYGKSYQ